MSDLSPSLLKLAVTIDRARLQANAIDATAPQDGAYGDLSEALKKVLSLIVGSARVDDAYQALLDGATVPSAITYARAN